MENRQKWKRPDSSNEQRPDGGANDNGPRLHEERSIVGVVLVLGYSCARCLPYCRSGLSCLGLIARNGGRWPGNECVCPIPLFPPPHGTGSDIVGVVLVTGCYSLAPLGYIHRKPVLDSHALRGIGGRGMSAPVTIPVATSVRKLRVHGGLCPEAPGVCCPGKSWASPAPDFVLCYCEHKLTM